MRKCPGISETHRHVPLRGNRPGSAMSRSQEAGAYAHNFITNILNAVLVCAKPAGRLKAGGDEGVQPSRHRGGQSFDPGGSRAGGVGGQLHELCGTHCGGFCGLDKVGEALTERPGMPASFGAPHGPFIWKQAPATKAGAADIAEEPGAAPVAPSREAKTAAENYMNVVQTCPCLCVENWRTLRDLGDALLAEARTIEGAAAALWEVRHDRGLDNLAGCQDADLEGLLQDDLLAYLREVLGQGAPARYIGERSRVEFRSHPGARQHLDQVYKQVWKDTVKGRTLLLTKTAAAGTDAHSSPFNPSRSSTLTGPLQKT